jgi:hypothetical protein
MFVRVKVERTNKHCHRSQDLATNMPISHVVLPGLRRGELLKQLLEDSIELGG